MSRAITALLPYYGSARLVAHHVGELLAGCRFACVPFAGGMSELAHIPAKTLVVSDLNRFAINLANVLCHPSMGPMLIRDLRRVLFHEDELRQAQATCKVFAENVTDGWEVNYEAAYAYFLCAWMTRSGGAGTGREFENGLAVRWDAGGGDSAKRLRTATESLCAWRRVRDRATFVVMDAFEMLERVKDEPGNGVYCDAPWPDDGDCYTHPFTEAQQRTLAARLAEFTQARVVVRFGDHPLVRDLYPEDRWEWHRVAGRTQANKTKAEVLLVNRTEVA